MKKGFVLWNGLLEKLAEDDSLEIIVLGTGSMARDMQTKLRLFNIKTAPFLIGGRDEPENGIRHYDSLSGLANPQNYRFICCYDVHEWMFIMPTFSIVYKILGAASWNHPKVIRFSAESALYEHAGKHYIDVNTHDCHLNEGHAYIALGDTKDKTAFKIHILGACAVSEIYRMTEYSISKGVHSELCKAGFNSVIYSWGQPINTAANNLILFLRDVSFFEPDLVILFTLMRDLSPICVSKKNLLAVNTVIDSHLSIKGIQSLYNGEISNGFNHSVGVTSIGATQNQIFLALSKLFNFSLWNVFSPRGDVISADKSRQLLGLSEGYLTRARKNKEDIIKAFGSSCVKDYTDTFDGIDDIFSVFADMRHFTDMGNKIIAKRLALDILVNFESQRNCKLEENNGKATRSPHAGKADG